ncbi:MAG: phosphoglycerate mutase (2,3-diphosphoglycerate-independent) [Flavobacteriales bacterium]|nr:phosphoglycerate mutase (2,3-diphosphoglycerate-independent) [Flavobacteriales bacterium]|tara:strand:+ start:4858 stop:6375 length:1518 start_codon:yes stop_codon:yes gene_type:complete
MKGKKTALIILDGWGHGDKTKSDAIHHANTPFINSLYSKYPNCELKTFGEHVGLPQGQMGNSEVGHVNIGAGRIVYQNLVKINLSCKDNSISEKENLKKTFTYVKENNQALHLIGLVSDGGIHSHQNHLYKLCELAQKEGIKNVFVHAFTDGRDCDPKSGKGFIEQLEQNLFDAKIASVCGRYFAMDRDKRWERIQLAYNLLTKGKGEATRNLSESIQNSYDNGITDEFIKPIVSVNKNNNPITTIKEGDAVICFNFRTDRCREITTVLTQTNMPEFGMNTLNLHYTTMTNYDETYKNINVIYDKENIKNTLGEVLENNNKTQIRIAETEKYPHVTFFFSGGREAEFVGEKRLMVKSPNVATYNLQPEMSAPKVTSTIVTELGKGETDFVCLNFANPDMVGHTGDYNAIKKAVETVDNCTQKVVEAGLKNDYAFIIIADHGNADFAINPDGTPNTAHSTNMVPCFALNTGRDTIEDGKLGDIAPTILEILGLEIPKEMTGKILIK